MSIDASLKEPPKLDQKPKLCLSRCFCHPGPLQSERNTNTEVEHRNGGEQIYPVAIQDKVIPLLAVSGERS